MHAPSGGCRTRQRPDFSYCPLPLVRAIRSCIFFGKASAVVATVAQATDTAHPPSRSKTTLAVTGHLHLLRSQMLLPRCSGQLRCPIGEFE